MLAFFRTLAKSKIVWIIIGLPLVAGLLLFGNVRSNLGGLFAQDAVIKAGSRTYAAAEFKREFEGYRQQMGQQGQVMSAEDMVAQGIDQRMLDVFSERESGAEELRRDNVVPTDKLVYDQIRKIPAFSIAGEFDKNTYERVLANNQLTPETFEKGLRDEIASNQFSAAAAAGLKPPRLMAAAISDFEFETHNLSVFSIDPTTLGAPPMPTDDQLKTLMNANAEALTTPETRIFTLVRFSAQALAPTLTPDPAEVKKRYDFRKDTLSTPEKRTLVQIPAKDAAGAAAIAAKLAKGDDPAAVAKASGVEPLNYADVTKGGVADPKVAEAAFALAEGKTSGPIQGQLGYAAVKVLKITPGHEVTLEEARPKIEEEIKAEMAVDKAYKLTQAYESAHEKGANLTDAAKAAGVPALSVGPVAANGADQTGKPLGLPPKLLKDGFALAQGAETDVEQDGKGEYFVVRADKVLPPAPPTLDKVRDRLTQFYQQREMASRMTARLTALADRVKKGETMDAVAASVGAKVRPVSLNRAMAQRNKSLSAEQVDRIMSAKVGDVFATGAAVAKVISIQPPTAAIAAATIGSAQQQLAKQIFDELGQESRAYAKTLLKTKINLAQARQAIGVTPDAGKSPLLGKPGPAAPARRAQ
jgi:peptidyl-prolyl cis-trans isomerase D